MPCSSDGRSSCEGLSEELDKVTAMLCLICQEFETASMALPSTEIKQWWKKHKEVDRERIERELRELKIKEDKLSAISKLTPYERKLLGLREL
jgi:hypothetical protein